MNQEAISMYETSMQLYDTDSGIYFDIEMTLRHLNREEEADVTHAKGMKHLEKYPLYFDQVMRSQFVIRAKLKKELKQHNTT